MTRRYLIEPRGTPVQVGSLVDIRHIEGPGGGLRVRAIRHDRRPGPRRQRHGVETSGRLRVQNRLPALRVHQHDLHFVPVAHRTRTEKMGCIQGIGVLIPWAHGQKAVPVALANPLSRLGRPGAEDRFPAIHPELSRSSKARAPQGRSWQEPRMQSTWSVPGTARASITPPGELMLFPQ